jgi:hypothetical protein
MTARIYISFGQDQRNFTTRNIEKKTLIFLQIFDDGTQKIWNSCQIIYFNAKKENVVCEGDACCDSSIETCLCVFQ